MSQATFDWEGIPEIVETIYVYLRAANCLERVLRKSRSFTDVHEELMFCCDIWRIVRRHGWQRSVAHAVAVKRFRAGFRDPLTVPL